MKSKKHKHVYVDKGSEPYNFTGVIWWQYVCSCGACVGYVCGEYAKGIC